MNRRKWEYLNFREVGGGHWYDLDLNEDVQQYETIRAAGLDGWELVNIVFDTTEPEPYYSYFFKREILPVEEPNQVFLKEGTETYSVHLSDPIEKLYLRIYPYNFLRHAEIKTISELFALTYGELVSKLGNKSMANIYEVKHACDKYGYSKLVSNDHWVQLKDNK